MNAIRQLGLAAIAGLLVSAAPLALAIAFAFRPSERRLALMRPLTLAGIFAAVANTSLGYTNTFVGLQRSATIEPGRFYAMLAESTVVPFMSFVCLSLAWLCVALGMRRQP